MNHKELESDSDLNTEQHHNSCTKLNLNNHQHFNGNEAGNGNGKNAVSRKYHISGEQKPVAKRCRSCSTKIFFFCTGFIVGLLLSLTLLSAFQYLSDTSRDLIPEYTVGGGTKYSSMRGRSMKTFDKADPPKDNSTALREVLDSSSETPSSSSSFPPITVYSSFTAIEEEEEEGVKTTRRSVSVSEPEVTSAAGTAIPDNSSPIYGESATTTDQKGSEERVDTTYDSNNDNNNSDNNTTPSPPVMSTWPEEEERRAVMVRESSAGSEAPTTETNSGVSEEERSGVSPVLPIDDQLLTTTEAVVNSSESEVEVTSDAVEVTTTDSSLTTSIGGDITDHYSPLMTTTSSSTTTTPSRDVVMTDEEDIKERTTDVSLKRSSDSEEEIVREEEEGEGEVTTNRSIVEATEAVTTTGQLNGTTVTVEEKRSDNSSDESPNGSARNESRVLLPSVGGNSTIEGRNETVRMSEMRAMTNSSGDVTPVRREEEEEEVFCLSSQFSCPNETNHCLDEDLLCDGFTDCPNDGFDEHNCRSTDCLQNFRCGLQRSNWSAGVEEAVKCISRQNYCDGIWDCEDGSDELGCHLTRCQKGEFLCKDHSQCIKGKQACDGVSHCPDHSDEKGCASKDQCEQSGRYFCAEDGLCIADALRCDGIADCLNGSDERDCETESKCSSREGFFFCANQKNCLQRSKRCDGNNDCSDWSDEFACVRVKSDQKSNVVHFYSPSTDTWSPLCARHDFGSRDADQLCQEFGQWSALNYSLLAVQPLSPGLWAVRTEEEGIQRTNHSTECETNKTVSVVCQAFKCGTIASSGQPLPVNNSSLVSSGEDVPSAVVVTDRSGGEECWAQVVASQWLLLSAKCLETKLLKNISEIQIKTKNKTLSVDRLIPHFRYSNFRSLRFADYDFALLHTDTPLQSQAVCLPSHPIDPAITCFVAKGSHWSEDVTYEVIERQVCNQSQHFNQTLTSRHFCAKRGPKSDQNKAECVPNYSPLMCLSSHSHWYVAGFVGYQYGCNGTLFSGYRYLTHPTVFSNVFAVKEFIETAINLSPTPLSPELKTYSEEVVQRSGASSETTTPPPTPVPVAMETTVTAIESTLSEDSENQTVIEVKTTVWPEVNATEAEVTTTAVITTFESFNDSLPTILANNSSLS